jgi:hypothetical protein
MKFSQFTDDVTPTLTTSFVGYDTVDNVNVRVPFAYLSSSILGGTNTVYVKSLADFPVPVAGVITLVDLTTYVVNGMVNIGANRIVTARNGIMGFTRGIDGIISTTSGVLITTVNAGIIIKDLALVCLSGTLFSVLNSVGQFGCQIKSCLLQGLSFGQFGGNAMDILSIEQNIIRNTFIGGSGITLVGAGNSSCVISENIISNNGGVFLDLDTSTWTDISIDSNIFTANVGQTLISGTASTNVITSGIISLNIFRGVGTYITGIAASDLKWLLTNNSSNFIATETLGELYMIANVTDTTFSAISTPTKVLGTTISGELARFTMSANNRLTYTGLDSVNLFASIAFSASKSGGGTQDARFFLYKNGIKVIPTTRHIDLRTNGDLESCVVQGFVPLVTGDYVELWVENQTSTQAVLVDGMNFSIV